MVSADYEYGARFLDHHTPRLLETGLYHADGQIQDEVYVYGSFLQSKMHQKGVRCTDCHNPHTAQLIHAGNLVCASCHRPEPPEEYETLQKKEYDTPAHHLDECAQSTQSRPSGQ